MARPLTTWLTKHLAQVIEKGDEAALLDASEPRGTALAVVGQTSVILAAGYVPAIAERVQLADAWLPALLTLTGGLCTAFAWRRRLEGTLALLATHVDNILYSLALVLVAATAAPPWDVAFAAVHGLMVLSFPAQHYPLVPSFAVVMAAPLVVVGLLSPPRLVVGFMLLASYVMVLVLSQYTRNRYHHARERARLQEAFLATRALADESTQLALGSMALSVGHFVHELRNQMAAQRINLEVLEEMLDLDGEAREALTDTLDAQHRQEAILEEVVATASRRAGASGQRAFELSALLRERAPQRAPRGLAIEVVTAEAESWVVGNPAHLDVALTNLLRNAFQAGATRVQLTVEITDDDTARLTIADDGQGFPEETRETMFSAFGESTKADGSGLGLYLTRRYLELLGGRVSIGESVLGGASFLIDVPVATSQEAALGRSGTAPAPRA